MTKNSLLLALILPAASLPYATLDAQYHWPVTPFDASHEITGTFCEYRDTGSSPHFHNGTDIPKPDGSPVYPAKDGIVTAVSPSGANAYVRVEDLAYVHIRPAPSLAVGDSVFATRTILGTILPGAGHVHFTDGFVGSERNALREIGGLAPYTDPWPPQISNVRFYLATNRARFPGTDLSGPVEITFRVREANGPPGTRESRLNNGAYFVGYQILSADRSQVVYSPTNDGIQFQFDNKPSNSYVHNVFDPTQSTTSSHVYRVTNNLRSRSWWDTSRHPEGSYTVMLFAGDTRENADTVYVEVALTPRDLIPPAQPTLLAVLLDDARPAVSWASNDLSDVAGYRLYVSADNAGWVVFQDETSLGREATSFQAVQRLPAAGYFYVAAVDSALPANESTRTDTYGSAPGNSGRRILIVDGFDRTQSSGSWHEPWHWFAFTHGEAIAANNFGFETCANDAVISGQIDLQSFDAVIWILGDESTHDETFSDAEQARVREFLQNGGMLFVSGSELAWDLGSRGSAADQAFLRDYLKIEYAGDDAENYQVRGADGGLFAGFDFRYGTSPYEEDWPDYFNPTSGGHPVLFYANGRVAGVQFEGTFPGGSRIGKLVVLGFPFETITESSIREQLMERVLQFFFPETTPVTRGPSAVPAKFALYQNYPNPFHVRPSAKAGDPGSTHFRFDLPAAAAVELHIYDLLGRRVWRWNHNRLSAGRHQIAWRGRDSAGRILPPGVYFLRIRGRALANGVQAEWQDKTKIIIR